VNKRGTTPANNSPPEKRKKKKRRKKRYAFPNSQESGGCQGFSAKYYPKRSEVWRFWRKPVGLDLYCRKAKRLSLHIHFFSGEIVFSFLYHYHKISSGYSGQTRRRNEYIPLEVRWKRAWGKRNE
jgi:hypothetical protein